MSSDQTTFGGVEWIGDQEPAPEPERVTVRTWEPESGKVCQNCGGFVSNRYHRVFSDNDGVLHACVNCCSNGEMFDGAGANL